MRGLHALAEAGLISFDRARKQSPRVTMLRAKLEDMPPAARSRQRRKAGAAPKDTRGPAVKTARPLFPYKHRKN